MRMHAPVRTRNIFGFLLLWHAIVLAVPAASALRSRYAIRDHGRLRHFELARDEFYVQSPASARGLRRVPAHASAETLRQHLEQHAADTGQQVRLVFYERGRPRNRATRRLLSPKVLVRLRAGVDARVLARAVGARRGGRVRYARDYAILQSPHFAGAPALAERLRALPGVVSADPLLARKQFPRYTPNDLYFDAQWHLHNVGQNGGTAGIDANLPGTWEDYAGAGVTIGIIDDGLEHTHPDLASNVNMQLCWDWNDGDADPSPGSADRHGTSVAGVAAARGDNAIGVCGAAYAADLVGLRLTAAAVTDADEAEAFSHSNDVIAVKNNSWGPYDDGYTLEGPGPLGAAALMNGAKYGRSEHGTIFVWAGGNGLEAGDNANYDGYANSIHTISVSALNDRGEQAYYSEPGACHVVTAPSSGSGTQGITTTDRAGSAGYNSTGSGDIADIDYTERFGGTSSSAPLVAGIVALMLEANPLLGWRDVQEILLRTATQISPSDPDWVLNAAGLHFNHKYGAGLVDAEAATSLAAVWNTLPPQLAADREYASLGLAIPDGDPAGLTQPFDFSNTTLRVEHVTVTAGITHAARGQLAVTLISPSGTESRLAEQHADTGDGYDGWTFSSVRHWGEASSGTWHLKITDGKPGQAGTVQDLRIDIYGTTLGGPQPQLNIHSTRFADSAGGNANASVEPGETIDQWVGLVNNGDGAAANLTATIATETPGVVMVQPSASYGTIAPGASATNFAPFQYRLAKSVPCGTLIEFTHVAQHTGEGMFTNTFSRLVGVQETIVTQTVESADVPVAIRSRKTALSENPVTTPMQITDVNVLVRLDHTYDQDLILSLRHPDATEVLLSQQQGGAGDNYGTGTCGLDAVPTRFDDQAPIPIAGSAAPFAGDYAPEGLLAAFDGRPATGTWVLVVQDVSLQDTGTLLCWSLEITGIQTQMACSVFNNAPHAYAQARTVAAGTGTVIQLVGTDPDEDPITYATNAAAQHGSISGFDPLLGSLTYTPSNGYAGPDSFSFRVHDGLDSSPAATVTLTVDDSGDMDGDGLPNEWEWRYGLDPNDPGGIGGNIDNGPDGDPDGDQIDNASEYTADTVPTNAESQLRITGIDRQGAQIRIDWQGGEEARQYLQYRRDLAATGETWTTLFTNTPPTPTTTNYLDAILNATNAFYRIQVERP